jgi:hypothetical protein
MSPPIDPGALRAVVRELLAEAMAAAPARAPGEHVVTIADDAQLQAFVVRLLGLFEHAESREALRSGRLRFRLASANGAVAAGGSAGADLVVESGALTERAVARAAHEGRRVVLGRRAVATPLALDKARSLGVRVERSA